MGIDLVVASLSTEWSHYDSASFPVLSSLDALVAFEEVTPRYDRQLAERAFRGRSRWDWSHRSKLAVAIRGFQDALSARFDCTIAWTDPGELEDHMGQLDVQAALTVRAIVERAGIDRFPNLAVLDIANMYLPVELPSVLVGQPRSLGSAPALRREIAALRDLGDHRSRAGDHLDLLEEACSLGIASSAVVLVDG